MCSRRSLASDSDHERKGEHARELGTVDFHPSEKEDPMKTPFLVYATLIIFSVFSITGCSSSNHTTGTSEPLAPATKVFSAAKEEVQRAAIVSFQKIGYLVTDQRIGADIITAERFTSTPFAEESGSSSKESSPNPFLVFLSIILIFGLIFMIFDAASNSTSDSSATKKSDEGEHHRDHAQYENGGPETITSYKYVMTVHCTALSDTSTRVKPVITKITMRNGAPTDSRAVSSSALLNEFYAALQQECTVQP